MVYPGTRLHQTTRMLLSATIFEEFPTFFSWYDILFSCLPLGHFPGPGDGFLSCPTTCTSHKRKPVHPGPWRLFLPTSAFPGVRRWCCQVQTHLSTWRQPPTPAPARASRWPLCAPSAAAASSTARWRSCSWSAWRSPSWLETWSRSLCLSRHGRAAHHRDTWKVQALHDEGWRILISRN